MKNEKVFYYSDPVNDDFAGTNINTCHVPACFCYIHKSVAYKILCFIVYYIIAFPLVWLMAKLFLGLKLKNRKNVKKAEGGFFLYGNHTNMLDAYIPSIASFPKKGYIVAGPDTVSIPGIKLLVVMLGAMPLPSELKGYRAFIDAINTRIKEGASVTVYPEAHIWPYYTGIRPFPDTSFRYPVANGAPGIAMVTTYRKRKGLFALCKRPGMTVTFSEPMKADSSLPQKQAQKELRNRVFDFMNTVSKETEQVSYIRYEQKKEEKEPAAQTEQ